MAMKINALTALWPEPHFPSKFSIFLRILIMGASGPASINPTGRSSPAKDRRSKVEKLEHGRLVTSDGKVITTSTWTRDGGKATSQTITTQHPSGKTTVERVSGGKLIP